MMRWLRWIAVLFAASVAISTVGMAVEGFWGSGEQGQTNWVDQSFGFLTFLGPALALMFAFLLIAAALAVSTPRVARRLLHR